MYLTGNHNAIIHTFDLTFHARLTSSRDLSPPVNPLTRVATVWFGIPIIVGKRSQVRYTRKQLSDLRA